MGIVSTKFEYFGDAYEKVLLPNSALEGHWHNDTIYASGAHSIPNLTKLAIEILQQKVDSRELDDMPPIQIREWVSLQFVTNAVEQEAASNFTGKLNG